MHRHVLLPHIVVFSYEFGLESAFNVLIHQVLLLTLIFLSCSFVQIVVSSLRALVLICLVVVRNLNVKISHVWSRCLQIIRVLHKPLVSLRCFVCVWCEKTSSLLLLALLPLFLRFLSRLLPELDQSFLHVEALLRAVTLKVRMVH